MKEYDRGGIHMMMQRAETGECLGRRLSVWEGQEKQEASRGTEGSH